MKGGSDGARHPLRWYDPLVMAVVCPLAALLIKLLMCSCRVARIEGTENERSALAASEGRVVYATWHQRMSYHFHFAGPRHPIMMISRSRDGEYAARLASWLGFKEVRGSSRRGGSSALRELIHRIRKGESAGMLADGPTGPPRIAKIGTVIIARDTFSPILPVLWGADRCWVLNSWDRYLIPKPFARVVIYFCRPISVPGSAKKRDLEEYRRRLEEALNYGARWCDAYFGVERPWRKE